MNRKAGAVVLLLATFAATAVHAQERPRRVEPGTAPWPDAGVVRVRVGPGVEGIMRMRDELKLSDTQLRQLEELRRQRVQREQDMIELRSRMEAGEFDREAMRSQMDDQRERARKDADAMRNRIDEILTREQRDRLEDRGDEVRYRVEQRLRDLREGRFPQEMRAMPPARGRLLPGGSGLYRYEIPRPGFERGEVAPRYYWFGTPGRGMIAPRVLRPRNEF